MLPLLSMTSPMLTGKSSRRKTETFCSTLSSNTRKFSAFNPSANRWRSSRTVVCSTTRLTLVMMRAPSWLALVFCPGGGGGVTGICENVGVAKRSAPAETIAARAARARGRRRKFLVAGGVISRLGKDGERRQSSGRANLDFELSPSRVVYLVAWSIAENILVSQLHADFCGDIRKVFQSFDIEYPPARHFCYFREKRRAVEFLRRSVTGANGIENADRIELGVCFLHQSLDVTFVVPTMIISSIR